MRNAELKWKVAYELRLAPLFRVPTSAFRVHSVYGTSTVIPSFATVV